MTDCFVAGMMAHDPLLQAVLRECLPHPAPRPTPHPAPRPANAPGHRIAATHDGAVGHIVAGGAGVTGLLIRLDDAGCDQLDHVMRATGASPAQITVQSDGPVAARVWLGPDATAPDWDGADWRDRFADAIQAAVPDILALRGHIDPARIARRLDPMVVRSASRLRAASQTPATLRRRPLLADVQVAQHRQPYANFFAVEEYDLRFRRFDGTMGPQVNRAAFVSGDAVTVLPYDAVRDRVLLVEQFRTGPYARGDANAWSLEAIAGRIDAGESPEEAGRREAVEEAGLTLGALLPVAQYYASPGAKTEFLYSYIALCDLPDGAAGVFGVEGEAEDIRGHLITFDRMMDLILSAEINNAPLILSALWLQRERDRLRGAVSPR